jgi:hypothetical protein
MMCSGIRPARKGLLLTAPGHSVSGTRLLPNGGGHRNRGQPGSGAVHCQFPPDRHRPDLAPAVLSGQLHACAFSGQNRPRRRNAHAAGLLQAPQVPAGRHPAGRLALLPVHPRLSGCRGDARPHGRSPPISSGHPACLRGSVAIAAPSSRRRGRRQILVMQATQHRSDAQPEALADPMTGWWCRGRHRANRAITAGTCKTARRLRTASHYEFATHRSTSDQVDLLDQAERTGERQISADRNDQPRIHGLQGTLPALHAAENFRTGLGTEQHRQRDHGDGYRGGEAIDHE